MEISNIDGPRLFLQEDLKAGLPVGERERVAMFKGHFCDQGMEFGCVRTVHTPLVMAIMETRVRGGGTFPATPPVIL